MRTCFTDSTPGALFLTALSLTVCSSCARNVVVSPIPGTEQVAIYEFCISVSPDEKWLAFTEWSLPKERVFKDLPPGEYESRIATLNLEDGKIVRHAVSSISAEAVGFSPEDAGWIGQAGLEIIEQRFRPPGWSGGMFYFQPYYQGVRLGFDPDVSGIQIVSNPEAPGACSDFPPVPNFQFRDRSWDLRSNDVSAVFREGAIRAVYYRGEGPYRTNMILSLQEAGEEKVVVERQERKGTMLTIAGVRVSPDERYLAYVVHSKKQAFLSGPREELFIRELATGREKKITRYGYMGNLIWSPGSSRLYFAGGEYSSDSAVRIVDVTATFSH